MNQVTVTQVSTVNDIAVLRQSVADAVVRAYGAERAYSHALCEFLPTEWYLTEHNDKGEAAKPVHAEKKALFAVLNAAKHSNPSTVWARVRKYAQEHIEGAPTNEGEKSTDSVASRTTRTLNLRLIEELVTLYKACKNEKTIGDKEKQAETYIASALGALGVDLATVM
jgi:hypothetical protein